MAQLVISAAGAAVGFAVGGPTGAQVGWAIGSMVGAAAVARQQRDHGPRLDDLKVTGTEYGQAIPWVQASPRVAGQIWWASDKKEIKTTTRQGKGGGAKVTEFTYEVDLLVGLSEAGPTGVRRIWSNGELIYNASTDAQTSTIDSSANTEVWTAITFLAGGPAAVPPSVYEVAVGAANAPAYRGRAALLIEGLQLGQSGQLPNLTFELSFDSYPPVDTCLLYADFTRGSLDGVGCDYSLPPVVSGDLSDASFDANGYSFDVDGHAGLILPTGISYIDGARFSFNAILAWTFELIFTAVKVVDWPSGEVYGQIARSSEGSFSTGNTAWVILYKPENGEVWLSISFIASVYHVRTGAGPIHVAIVRPSGTINAGNPIKWYIDGQLVYTQVSNLQAGGINSIDLGGFAGVTPPLEVSRVTYRQVKLTRGVVYAAAFAPPTDLTGPVCIATHDQSTATLRAAVNAICDRAGMPSGLLDTEPLDAITKPVRALAVASVTPARAVLEQLQAGWFFDARLDDKLRFVPRAQASVATIPHADLAAGPEQAAEQPLPLTIGSDLELSPQVAVQYINLSADHNTGTEWSDRLLSGQGSTQTVQLGIGMLPAEAKGIADAIVADGVAGLTTTQIRLPQTYARLQPADVVTVVDDDGSSYRLRLVRREDAAGVLAYDAVLDDASVVVSAEITDEDYTPQGVVLALPATEYRPLDIPLLRDADDSPGWYVAARGATGATNWPGASVLSSSNDTDFTTAAQVAEAAVMGQATTALGAWSGGWVMDEVNSVTVNVGDGELESTTRDALLADATRNAILLGSEVVRYVTATLVTPAPNIYTLSRLLRGQQGTEWATGGHAIGERAVLLRPQGLRRVSTDAAAIGQLRYLRGVTSGGAIDAVNSTTFTNSGVSLRPWAPVGLRTQRQSGDFVWSWWRRTRLSVSVLGLATGSGSVPLGEAAEAYEIDVMNGGAVVRTIASQQPAAAYTVAQQIADWGAVQTSVAVRIHQMAAGGRRGYALAATSQTDFAPAAQVNTIALSGVFTAGVTIAVYAGPSQLVGYVVQAGDTNLAGVATALAAALDALADFSASAAGADVTVTGRVGLVYELRVAVSGSSQLNAALVQQATTSAVAQGFEAHVYLRNPAGGAVAPLPGGLIFAVRINRADGGLFASVSYTTTAGDGPSQVMAGLAFAVMQSEFLFARVLASVQTAPSGEPYLRLQGISPYGSSGEYWPWEPGSAIGIGATDGAALQTVTVREPAPPTSPAPQIVEITCSGTVLADEVFRATVDGALYSYTASGGDSTADVAAALAPLIDAGPHGAAAAGSVVTVTGQTDGVPYSYGTSILRQLVATVT